jgi:hypothetical protein
MRFYTPVGTHHGFLLFQKYSRVLKAKNMYLVMLLFQLILEGQLHPSRLKKRGLNGEDAGRG